MNLDQMDSTFAQGLRASLVEQVTAAAPARRRRHRWWVGAGVFAGVGVVGGIGAATAGFFTEPGADIVTEVQEPVTGTYTGTQTIELGTAPDGATHIMIDLTCLTPGTLYWPDGGRMVCGSGDEDSSGFGSFPLFSGQVYAEVKTSDPDLRYEVKVAYENRAQTDWAVNENGNTYGARNNKGEPDLISVITTDGQRGYAYTAELNEASGMKTLAEATSPAEALARQEAQAGTVALIPVYESDGETVIGEFEAGRW